MAIYHIEFFKKLSKILDHFKALKENFNLTLNWYFLLYSFKNGID